MPRAQALPRLSALELLSLRCNHVGNAGAEALAEALPSCASLQQFFIQGNDLAAAGVAAVTAAVPRCHTLTELRLGGRRAQLLSHAGPTHESRPGGSESTPPRCIAGI